MSEIKSTLDLVMERTRGLSLTDREKEELREKELSGKIKSLLERFIAEYRSLKWLESAIAALGDGNGEVRKALKSEILDRLSPEGENDKHLEILEKIVGVELQAYRELISEYGRKLSRERDRRMDALKKKLADGNISGSAVVPNIDADPLWAADSEKILREFRKRAGSI